MHEGFSELDSCLISPRPAQGVEVVIEAGEDSELALVQPKSLEFQVEGVCHIDRSPFSFAETVGPTLFTLLNCCLTRVGMFALTPIDPFLLDQMLNTR